MKLVAWAATIADLQGDVVPAASVTITQNGQPAEVFNIAGDPLPSNVVAADETGQVEFKLRPGIYTIVSTVGTVQTTWSDVPFSPVSSFINSKPIAGTAHTVTKDDLDLILVFDTPDPVTITLPEDATEALDEGFSGGARNKQAGAITYAAEGSDVLEGAGATTNDATKVSGYHLESKSGGVNVYVTSGDLS